MKNAIMVDTRLKNKIENMTEHNDTCYSIKFKDIQDTFFFDDIIKLQDFINVQSKERYYDKELRNGYFDYINEHGELLRYTITSNRGTLTVLKDECIS